MHVRGTISSAGFDDGHRFVIGCWHESPIGAFGDVMWAQPDDTRVLLAPSAQAASFITSIYAFDDVRIGPLAVESDGRSTTVNGLGLAVHLNGGRLRPLPLRRPRFITRYVEAPIAKALMGVRTYGVSSTGAREWYQSYGWRWVVSGHAALNERSLGAPRRIDRPIGVGFSEPPQRPSLVQVRVGIELASAPERRSHDGDRQHQQRDA